jgi:hypothetical protein
MAARGIAVVAAVATAAATITWIVSSPAEAAGLSPFDIAGRGATVPFVEHEAERAAHTGTSTGTSRLYGTLSAEASGREAVTLDAGNRRHLRLTFSANTGWPAAQLSELAVHSS